MNSDDLMLIAWKAKEFDKIQAMLKISNREFVSVFAEHDYNDLASVRAHRRELAEILKQNNIDIPRHIKDKI